MAWKLHRSRLLLVALAISSLVGGSLALRRYGPNAGALRETSIVMNGRPVILGSGSSGSVLAHLSSDPRQRTFLWPQNFLAAGSMTEAKELRFTFFETRSGSLPSLELSKIEDDSGTLYDASVCQIHRENMHRTRVMPLTRSEKISPSPLIEATTFPRSGVIVAEEGMGSFEIPTWVCDSCRRERERWLDKAHRAASTAN